MTEILEKETPVRPSPKPGNAKCPAQPQMKIVVVNDNEGLAEHLAAWDDLARNALEPNPFYESWMLIAAWRRLGKDLPLSFTFVYQLDPEKPETKPKLCGFFPLHKGSFQKLPVPVLSLWKHVHCYLCTPLLRPQQAKEALNAVLDWARDDPRGAPLFEFNMVSGEGAFHRLFTEVLYERNAVVFLKECFTRAFWRAGASAESYLAQALSSSGRQDFRRKRKRLGELGKLESRTLGRDGDVDLWSRQFLDLEASGWKGDTQTALTVNPVERDYFLEIARSAFERDQLQMLGLFLDGKPIALKCNFRSGDAAFFYKPAYDEAYARFSPGALLELDHFHLCHQDPPVRWMDYCTAPDSPLANRICIERRPIQSLLLSTGRAPGDLLVSLRPLARWLARRFKRSNGHQ